MKNNSATAPTNQINKVFFDFQLSPSRTLHRGSCDGSDSGAFKRGSRRSHPGQGPTRLGSRSRRRGCSAHTWPSGALPRGRDACAGAPSVEGGKLCTDTDPSPGPPCPGLPRAQGPGPSAHAGRAQPRRLGPTNHAPEQSSRTLVANGKNQVPSEGHRPARGLGGSLLAGATPHAAVSAPPLSKDLPDRPSRSTCTCVSLRGWCPCGQLSGAVCLKPSPRADMQLLGSPCHRGEGTALPRGGGGGLDIPWGTPGQRGRGARPASQTRPKVVLGIRGAWAPDGSSSG